jgi:hypothetical protein
MNFIRSSIWLQSFQSIASGEVGPGTKFICADTACYPSRRQNPVALQAFIEFGKALGLGGGRWSVAARARYRGGRDSILNPRTSKPILNHPIGGPLVGQ